MKNVGEKTCINTQLKLLLQCRGLFWLYMLCYTYRQVKQLVTQKRIWILKHICCFEIGSNTFIQKKFKNVNNYMTQMLRCYINPEKYISRDFFFKSGNESVDSWGVDRKLALKVQKEWIQCWIYIGAFKALGQLPLGPPASLELASVDCLTVTYQAHSHILSLLCIGGIAI